MTRENESAASQTAAARLIEQGLDGKAARPGTLGTEVVKEERAATFGDQPDERSRKRLGYVDGSEPRPALSHPGKLHRRIPQRSMACAAIEANARYRRPDTPLDAVTAAGKT